MTFLIDTTDKFLLPCYTIKHCLVWCLDRVILTSSLLSNLGSRGGRPVTRLAFQANDPGSIPGAGSHISFIFSLYLFIVFITVHRMGMYSVDPVYRSWTPGTYKNQGGCVGILCLSVSDCCLSFVSSMHDKCVNIITWIDYIYIVLKGRKKNSSPLIDLALIAKGPPWPSG